MGIPYGLSIRTPLNHGEARDAIIASLKQEGFGVLPKSRCEPPLSGLDIAALTDHDADQQRTEKGCCG